MLSQAQTGVLKPSDPHRLLPRLTRLMGCKPRRESPSHQTWFWPVAVIVLVIGRKPRRASSSHQTSQPWWPRPHRQKGRKPRRASPSHQTSLREEKNLKILFVASPDGPPQAIRLRTPAVWIRCLLVASPDGRPQAIRLDANGINYICADYVASPDGSSQAIGR